MSVSSTAHTGASGLSTAVNTIAAPAEAFETLRVAPTWGWACILTLVLMLAGAFLQGPASRHAAVASTQHMVATSSLFANAKPADKQNAIERAGKPSPWSYILTAVTLFCAVLFNTIIMLIGNAAGRGQADFKRLWCGSMNIALPTLGLGAIVLGIIMTIRGADAFNGTPDIVRAMPSLALLAPGASFTVMSFLSGFSIFSLWGLYLNATMLRTMAKTGTGVAYTFAAIVTVLGACIAAGFAALAHSFGAA